MDRTNFYSLLHYLDRSRAMLNYINSDQHIQINDTIYTEITKAVKDVESLLSSHQPQVNGSETETTESDEKQSEDDMLEKGYEVLKEESKPGPTYLSRATGWTMTQARMVYKQLIDSGRIVKGKKAIDLDTKRDEPAEAKPETTTKKSTGKNKPANPKIMELISELPNGDDMLLPLHLRRLIALPKGKRGPYLSGLKLDDLVTTDDIARGAVNGVNTILIDEVNSLARSRRPKAKDEDIIKCSKNGSEREQRYFRIRLRCIKAIGNGGKELYLHMASGGLTTRVLSDLQIIAKARVDKQV